MTKNWPPTLGRLIKRMRAGLDKTVCRSREMAGIPSTILVESSAFGDGQPIPIDFTDSGRGISPPLRWSGVDSAAATILIIEDADSPTPSPFIHLIAWEAPGKNQSLSAGAFPSKRHPGEAMHLGRNGMYKCEYTPPDPPPGHGVHRYVFQVFCLDVIPEFKSPPGKSQLLATMRGHVRAKGVLTGTFGRA